MAAEVLPGYVDDAQLEEVQKPIQDEQDAFSDYMTIRELAYVSRISINRIRHAVTYAKLRPMAGVKRGPLWFINKSEALRWAMLIAEYERTRWERNIKRIGWAQQRHERKQELLSSPYSPRHMNYQRPPFGTRTYTYQQAADAMGTTLATVYMYAQRSGMLGGVTRYLSGERIRLLDADQVDAVYADHWATVVANKVERAAATAQRRQEREAAKEAERQARMRNPRLRKDGKPDGRSLRVVKDEVA